MGCSASAQFQFNINICDVYPTEDSHKVQIRQNYKEVFTMQEKMNVIQYMQQSNHEEFNKFFKNRTKLKESVFYFAFDDKTTCIAEFEDASSFIPKDEYSYYRKGNSAMILSNVFIIPADNFIKFHLTKKHVFKQIEKMHDPRDALINTMKEYTPLKSQTTNNIPEIKEEVEDSISNRSSKSSIKCIKIQKEETITPKEIITEDKFTLTDYDSDSSNSLVDEDPEMTEAIICKNEITQENLKQAKDIVTQEKDKTIGLKSLSIIYNKITTTEKINKLLDIISCNPLHNTDDPNSEIVKKETDPLYLKIFNFNENNIDSNLESDVWNKIQDFLKTKRTFKAIKTKADELDLRKYKVLRELSLSICNINDSQCKSIIKSIRHTRLHKLDLQGNFISLMGVLDISHWIMKNKSLKELYLQNNIKIDTDGIVELLKNLKFHSKIEILNLSHIDLNSTGKHLIDLFTLRNKEEPSKSRLKILKIRDCNLSYSDIVLLYEGASTKSCSLDELDISGNNNEGNIEVCKMMIGFISNVTSISNLYLENNKINQYGLLSDNLGMKAFNKNPLYFISISDSSINYFSLFTNLIGGVSSISENLTNKEVELVVCNDNRKPDKEDNNVLKEFNDHNTRLKLNF